MTDSSPRFTFKSVRIENLSLVHSWLVQPHIAEWIHGVGLQNTLNDLEKFFQRESNTTYWIAYDKDIPFAFLITSPEGNNATTLDLFICDLNYLGKGIAVPMIREFLISQFPNIKRVLIDPEATNKRAIHVYQKVGFKIIGEFIASWHPVLHYQMELYMKDLLATNVSHTTDAFVSSPMNYTIEFVDKISDAEEDKMTKDLVAYESAHGIDVNYKKFSIVLKDGSGIVFGVLNAFTAFAEIYIDDIWVDNAYRGKGFGKQLLQKLESHFQGKGFNNINLVTSAFQAPGFYQKCGFQAEFVRINKKNPKLTKTFFVKFFNDEVQTQGILKSKEPTDKTANKKSDPLIVGISGISGAGKTTLIKKLAETLQSTTIYWDDYDEISQAPQDYVEWFHSSKNYNDWIYPELVDTLHKLKKGETIVCPATRHTLTSTKYILFDAPLGYCHQPTGKYIDFLICLDTPLDIALARRLIRDYRIDSNTQKMIQELQEYLSKSRPLFILFPEEKTSDLIVDGSLTLEEQEKQVLDALSLLERV